MTQLIVPSNTLVRAAGALTTPMGRQQLRLALGYKTSPKNLPAAASVMSSNSPYSLAMDRGRVGRPHARMYRNWAEHGEWVRAALNIRKTQVAQSEWDIVKDDPDGPEPSEALKKRIRDFLKSPNQLGDSFRSLIEPLIEDLLVLDAGVIEKERTYRGDLVALHPVDAAQIRVSKYWDGNPDEARYYYYPDDFERAKFINADMVYLMESSATYRVVGLSKLETLKNAIDAELNGHTYNARQVTQAAPDGMLDLGEGARGDQVEAFQRYWQAEVAGRGSMAFIGGSKNAKFIPFRGSNRDMQFLEWQMYLVRKITAVFGMAAMDLGMGNDVNRATADTQQENTEDRGLRPLLGIIGEYFTREIVWDDTFGGPSNNLAFRWTRLNLQESMSRAQINRHALAGVSWKTVNEARRGEGLEPLKGPQYNSLLVTTPTGAVTLDDVPTAREAVASKQQAGPGTPPAGGGSKPSGGQKPPTGK